MSRRKPKVVYWNHSPTPYFVERFNAVADRGNVDLEAWFNTRREAIRSWDVDESQWRFRARYIPARPILGLLRPVPVAELRDARPDLLVQEYDRSHLTLGFLAGTRLAGRTAFRVLPNYDSWSERTWWREAGKHFVFRAVDAAKVPGPDGAALARRYGLGRERIARVTQSVDVARLAAGRDGDEAARERTREHLDLHGCVFAYCGRLWQGKGLDDLISAYAELQGDGLEVSLLLIGDGPDEERYRRAARRLRNVAFAGFAQSQELVALYGAADALVFPTLGDPHGLVVEEAMAAGLPVVCSSNAGDIDLRLPDGQAGFVVPARDPRALAERMRALARDEQLRARMGERARELVRERGHDRYAEDFESFVQRALALPRRGGSVARAARLLGTTLALAAGERASAPLLQPTSHEDRRTLAGRT
jgi:glycosyltransferase involved in cell wall biosynthesis